MIFLLVLEFTEHFLFLWLVKYLFNISAQNKDLYFCDLPKNHIIYYECSRKNLFHLY
jgi:hypothetical protein